MGAHEQTSPFHESGGLYPTVVERTDKEEDIKDMKPSVETPDTAKTTKKNSLMLGVIATTPS